MAEFGSKGVSGAGLGLGIAGTALGILNGGLGNIGNLFGNGRNAHYCGEDGAVNRYELGLQQRIAALESGIALRDANIYNDSKILETYKYFDGKIEAINAKIAEQAVFNATATATMNCMGGQIAQLFALTKLVVPNSSICPALTTTTT
jgi:hypothetical protein